VAKRTIGFEDYTPAAYEEYTGEAPPANQWFTGEVTRAKYLPEDDQVRFSIELVDHPDYAGWGKGWFAPFEGPTRWKMHEIIRALQGGQEKPVTLDWENDAQVAAWLKKQKRIKFQTEMYNDDIKIKKVRPIMEAVGGKTAPSATKAAAPAAVAEPEPEASDEELEDYTEDDLTELSNEELEEILTDEFEFAEEDLPELTARQAKLDKDGSKLKAKLIEAILEAQAEDTEDPAAEDGAADADGDEDLEDGFAEDPEDTEPEPEPEPAPRTRRTRAAAAPAKAAAPAATTRRRRG
jgi:hypothetical protein